MADGFKFQNLFKNYFALKEINPIIRILTISDILVIGGYGFISPIFAVFITDTIKGGSLEVVGMASGIYVATYSLLQIPLGIIIDKIKGERDDFMFLLAGSILFSVVPLLYLFISTPIHLYLVQIFYGFAMAATLPTWLAIFTRHIDKGREGVEWGIYKTLTDLTAAATAFIGGFIASRYSFVPLFILVSLTSFIGSFFLLGVYRSMFKKKF